MVLIPGVKFTMTSSNSLFSLFKTLPSSSTSITTSTTTPSTQNDNSTSKLSPSNTTTTTPSGIYCKRRNGQVLELNTTNFQLNLVSTSTLTTTSTAITPTTFLYTLQHWPLTSTPKSMEFNGIGNLLAILGTSGNVTILRFQQNSVSEEIEINFNFESSSSTAIHVTSFNWHPASPADYHLVTLSKSSGLLSIFDVNSAKKVVDSEYDDTDSHEKAVPQYHITEPELSIKLSMNRADPFVGVSFVDHQSRGSKTVNNTWLPFTAFLIKESGDVMALCPFVPTQFRALRQKHLIPLSEMESNSSIVTKWLDETLRSCEFKSSSSTTSSTVDTDWILAKTPISFLHLQPRLQGPFLVQPEPMDIHHLSSYDRVVHFKTDFLLENTNQEVLIATIAFGSGKVDFLALISEINPEFQLISESHNISVSSKTTSSTSNLSGSDEFPVMALLESVDLGNSQSRTATTRRQIDNKVKILDFLDDRIILSNSDSVFSIQFNLDINATPSKTSITHNDEYSGSGSEYEEVEDSSSISCDATVLLGGLKNQVQCISNGLIYPGAQKIDIQNQNNDKDTLTSAPTTSFTSSSSSLLDSVTKYAFPLGKMEIERGSIQLEGLIEDLVRTAQKLKSWKGSSNNISTLKLPEVNEMCASELNEHVSEWQRTLVTSSLRVGHEISLRSEELVSILRREREILMRARTILTSKPEKLVTILQKVALAKEKGTVLLERFKKLVENLKSSSHATNETDTILLHELKKISGSLNECCKIPLGLGIETGNEQDRLIKSQLSIQNELLLKLKNQLEISRN